MRKPVFFLLLLASFGWASAPAAKDCVASGNACAPVIGCLFGERDEMFLGEVNGLDAGDFKVRTSAGATCTGDFIRYGANSSVGSFTCDDGRVGSLAYQLVDSRTGTGRGKGLTTSGESLTLWAGDNVVNYLRAGTDVSERLFLCVRDALSN